MNSWGKYEGEMLSRSSFERDKFISSVEIIPGMPNMQGRPNIERMYGCNTDDTQQCRTYIYTPINPVDSAIEYIEIVRDDEHKSLLRVTIIFNPEVSEEELRRYLWSSGFTMMFTNTSLKVFNNNQVKLIVYPGDIPSVVKSEAAARVEINDFIPTLMRPDPSKQIFTGNSAQGLALLFNTLARLSPDLLEFFGHEDFSELTQEHRVERITGNGHEVLTADLYQSLVYPSRTPTWNGGPQVIYIDQGDRFDEKLLEASYVGNSVLVLNFAINIQHLPLLSAAVRKYRNPDSPFKTASILFAEGCSISPEVINDRFMCKLSGRRVRVFEFFIEFEFGREFLSKQCAKGLRIPADTINDVIVFEDDVIRIFATKHAQDILCANDFDLANKLNEYSLSLADRDDGNRLYELLTRTSRGQEILASHDYSPARKTIMEQAEEDEEEIDGDEEETFIVRIPPKNILFSCHGNEMRSPMQNLLAANTQRSMLIAYYGYYRNLPTLLSAFANRCARISQRSALKRLPLEMGKLVAEMLMVTPSLYQAIADHLDEIGSNIPFDEEVRARCKKYILGA